MHEILILIKVDSEDVLESVEIFRLLRQLVVEQVDDKIVILEVDGEFVLAELHRYEYLLPLLYVQYEQLFRKLDLLQAQSQQNIRPTSLQVTDELHLIVEHLLFVPLLLVLNYPFEIGELILLYFLVRKQIGNVGSLHQILNLPNN